MKGVFVIKTLGCKANSSDAQQLQAALQGEGWLPQVEEEAPVDLCVVNSCSVTDEADRQSLQFARKLSIQYPQAKIVVTGCGAEAHPDFFLNAPGIDYVLGNREKKNFISILNSHILKQTKPHSTQLLGETAPYSAFLSQHPIEREWGGVEEGFSLVPPSETQRTRVFFKIQEGCNSFCTYCIIPYARGPKRSFPVQQVIAAIQTWVEQEGVQEVVLTGTNLGDYGLEEASKNPPLEVLLEQILSQTSLKRLRLSSLDPTEITPAILSLMQAEPRLCPHFHVSLQSPISRILRLMKRRYRTEEVVNCLQKIQALSTLPSLLQRGGIYVGMDLIAGFPGETNEEFEEGFELLKTLPWTRLHVFPYSERQGTPATRLPHSVPPGIRADRAKRLRALSLERLQSTYRNLLVAAAHKEGGVDLGDVLLEKPDKRGWRSGLTSNYFRIVLPPGEVSEGDLEKDPGVQVQPMELMVDRKQQDVAFLGRLV